MKDVELLVFDVSGVHLAVPLSLVEEVVPSSQITRIPRSPPFLLGLAAVRGKAMGVIDAAIRYGLPPSLSAYFLVCEVRGNVTAITIDRPMLAGGLHARQLGSQEVEGLRIQARIDSKFVLGAYEVYDKDEKSGAVTSMGIRCLLVNPDLFVSAEMASLVGEAA
jgi:chemotaxis signal transduction protein